MKRSFGAVVLASAVVALAGCGGGTRGAMTGAVSPVAVVSPVATNHASLGLRLSPLPARYRPWRSASEIVDRWRRLPGAPAGVTPAVHLWTVNGAYPAWVVAALGPGSTSVAVYDLRGRRWTMNYTLPPSRHAPPCRDGLCGFPVNQGALDMAAGYAERVAGAAHVFTSDAIDDASDHVIVHLAHSPRSVIAALTAEHPETYVIHNDGLRTLSAVMALERSLDFAALHSHGVDIVSAWPSEKGRLIVGVTKNIKKAQAYFDETYGRGFAHVVHGEPAEAAYAAGPTHPIR